MLTQKYHYVIADLRMPCRKVQFNISGKINITCFKLLEDSDEENQKLISRWRQEHSDDMSVFEENQAGQYNTPNYLPPPPPPPEIDSKSK